MGWFCGGTGTGTLGAKPASFVREGIGSRRNRDYRKVCL